jgi:hypothetical protein
MEVNINFEEASYYWNTNKKKLKNGNYQYICCSITKNNKPCSKKPMKYSNYCYSHNKNST